MVFLKLLLLLLLLFLFLLLLLLFLLLFLFLFLFLLRSTKENAVHYYRCPVVSRVPFFYIISSIVRCARTIAHRVVFVVVRASLGIVKQIWF